MSEYDLKKSESGIGQLYPILEAKDGEIIDGLHREQADKNWKRTKLEHIDTEEKKILARAISNWHRREATREEKEEWINGLAQIYQKQGYKVAGKRQGKAGSPPNEIRHKLVQVTGLHPDTVNLYLASEYKQDISDEVRNIPRVLASQAIESKLGDYGHRLIQRHREEVKEELKRDPVFQREVLEEIRKPQIKPKMEIGSVCLPETPIESGPPKDFQKLSEERFFSRNQACLCKTCPLFRKCGIYY